MHRRQINVQIISLLFSLTWTGCLDRFYKFWLAADIFSLNWRKIDLQEKNTTREAGRCFLINYYSKFTEFVFLVQLQLRWSCDQVINMKHYESEWLLTTPAYNDYWLIQICKCLVLSNQQSETPKKSKYILFMTQKRFKSSHLRNWNQESFGIFA